MPFSIRQLPTTLAGTIQSSASHQSEQSFAVARSSGSQSLKPNVLATMRVPGVRLWNLGSSLSMFAGSR